MNILLLTPDAVGGTFLRRMLAIYMQLHEFDRPVIDVGHLELGLETYYSPTFNQQILKTKKFSDFTNMQSLSEIRAILESVDHYKIVKLPHYNINGRQDPINEQIPFYHYLNENYFIISCRRNNTFEHAISWALNKLTKTLNVYSVEEKFAAFSNMYVNGVNIDPLSLKQSLETYKKYIKWTEDHFRISSYYYYEKDMPNIEKYILSLPIFGGQKKLVTWKDTFGQEVNDWNKCHYYLSDIGSLASTHRDTLGSSPSAQLTSTSQLQNLDSAWQDFVSKYNSIRGSEWPDIDSLSDWEYLPDHIKKECNESFDLGYYLDAIHIILNQVNSKYSTQISLNENISNIGLVKEAIVNQHREFLSTQLTPYQSASSAIAQMQTLGILEESVPIKKLTFREKKAMIKNFSECMDQYNEWAAQNPEFGQPVTEADLALIETADQNVWKDVTSQNLLTHQGKNIL